MVTIGIPGHIFEKIELVIFDKDGTLMEVHHYWARMVKLRAELITKSLHLGDKHTKALVSAMGVDPATGTIYEGGPVGIKKREDVMQAAVKYLDGRGYAGTWDLCNRVFEDVDRISKENLAEFIVPIPGAPAFVRSLAHHGCKTAIATTDRSSRGLLAMECLGIAESIDLVVGADMVRKTKPDPEMIHLILERMNIRKEHAIMVGDATTDIRMGVDAGLLGSIGVITGITPESHLRTITPYVIGSVADMRIL
jgi:phosphoglycolate phosphatase-like HAD superfamily hydrolase